MHMETLHYYLESDMRRYQLKPEQSYSLGRNPDHAIFLADPTVSRNHARILWKNDSFEIRDTESTNGILLNGKAVHAAQLFTGDRIQVGAVQLRYYETWNSIEDTLSPDDSVLIEKRMQDLAKMIKDPGLKSRFDEMVSLFNVKKRNLSELAYRDPLTGLLNRRSFDKTIHTEWKRRKRYQRPLSLIMIDIDHFKKVNDRYGHQKGDSILKTVGAIIHENVRSSDSPCRYGGEELAVILPETGLQSAIATAEKLRSLVATQVQEIEGIPVTVSLGVGAFKHTMKQPDDLVAAADHALYTAKKEGRNQVSA